MLKIIISSLILIVLSGCSPKLSNSEHHQNLVKVMEATSKGNYRQLGETMPTDFWLVYNKENYLNRFQELGKIIGPIEIKNFIISDVIGPVQTNGYYFQIVNYSVDMEINTSNIPANVLDQYTSSFGSENIRLDSNENRLYVKNRSQMLAVYERKSDQWKYMELSLPSVTEVYGLETSNELEEYVR